MYTPNRVCRSACSRVHRFGCVAGGRPEVAENVTDGLRHTPVPNELRLSGADLSML
jgi:hypothetical protein